MGRPDRNNDVLDAVVDRLSPPTLMTRFRSLRKSIVQHRRILLLTAVVNFGTLVFGYDSGIAGAVIVLPSFQRDFSIDGDEEARANLNSNIVSILFGGAFLGALVASQTSYYLGRRTALMIGNIFFLIGGAVQTACFGSVEQLYVGRFLAGIGVGTVSQVSPVYVSECATKSQRSRAVSAFQLNLVTGGMLAYWMGYGVSVHISESLSTQWRIPIGFQLVPGVLFGIGLLFVPESPRFLVRKQIQSNRRRAAHAQGGQVPSSTEVPVLAPQEQGHEPNSDVKHDNDDKELAVQLATSSVAKISPLHVDSAEQTPSSPSKTPIGGPSPLDKAAEDLPERMMTRPVVTPFHYLTRRHSSNKGVTNAQHISALTILSYLRNLPPKSPEIQTELSEIYAQVMENEEYWATLSPTRGDGRLERWKELLRKKSNRRRLVIVAFVAVWQIWIAQTAVLYYAPTIFKSIGFSSNSTSLLASGVFTCLKFTTTIAAIILTVNRYGRVVGLSVGAFIQGVIFFTIGAILATHPVQVSDGVERAPTVASKIMMALIYAYVIVYSFAHGPLPWLYASELFPLHLREAGQLVFTLLTWSNNFALAKVTPIGFVNIGYDLCP
ncbi:hypothetical protein FRC02_000095 [Tulasnella sp. 418]|nr:hypothetical protein FRC02_000095 [Tulasnella sp. 418]